MKKIVRKHECNISSTDMVTLTRKDLHNLSEEFIFNLIAEANRLGAVGYRLHGLHLQESSFLAFDSPREVIITYLPRLSFWRRLRQLF